MATKTSKQNNNKTASTTTTTTTTSSGSRTSTGFIINICSYIAVCVGGLALFISFILSKVGVSASFVGAMQTIANAIAWAVVSFLSFRYIRRRHKLWMWIVWVIAIVMIIMGIILV